MSVLEKIVQAEKDARELLQKAKDEQKAIFERVHDELEVMKNKNAQDLSKQIEDTVRKANNEISVISASYAVKKDEITNQIALRAANKKHTIVEKIFKDIVGA